MEHFSIPSPYGTVQRHHGAKNFKSPIGLHVLAIKDHALSVRSEGRSSSRRNTQMADGPFAKRLLLKPRHPSVLLRHSFSLSALVVVVVAIVVLVLVVVVVVVVVVVAAVVVAVVAVVVVVVGLIVVLVFFCCVATRYYAKFLYLSPSRLERYVEAYRD
ncbi:hypothetical protein ElyMa_002962200 [Elysia marginata]|uniref:Uncharacterized protein n=1 Tax=Elysia marginata TaxID=1093978 RepID=A0AAV4I7M9_9GAST|nr:hypothetical protein ElyMa_002962200 [Elysia marginata]